MPKDTFKPNPDQMLSIANMVSTGAPLKEAVKKVRAAAERNATPAPSKDRTTKLSAPEKKKALTAQIQALGGEVPESNLSVAKFQEALTAAQTAADAAKDDKPDEDADGKPDTDLM